MDDEEFKVEVVTEGNKKKDIKCMIDDLSEESGISRDNISTTVHTLLNHIKNILNRVEDVILEENKKVMDNNIGSLIIASMPSLPLNLTKIGLSHLAKFYFIAERKIKRSDIEMMKKMASDMIEEELKAIIKEE